MVLRTFRSIFPMLCFVFRQLSPVHDHAPPLPLSFSTKPSTSTPFYVPSVGWVTAPFRGAAWVVTAPLRGLF